MAAIEADLHHQESDQHVCYQAPCDVPPDDEDAESSITFSNEKEKIKEENLTNLLEMTPEKPPDPKCVIESDQELLSVEH